MIQTDVENLRSQVGRFQAVQAAIVEQVRKVIVGQDEVLEQLMIALFVGGHCLITGMPGTAKTLLVRTMAQTLGLEFKRIQFTPDLMPSDITGTDILEDEPGTGRRIWTFVQGPIFGNVLLADEINRTPPKTQAALLEAMQELTCTVRGNHYKLPAPFFVLATQNPIELEGTYPLPEAQLDRFMFKIKVGYPSRAEEIAIMQRVTGLADPDLKPVLSKEAILQLQDLVRRVPVADHIFQYVATFVRSTRPDADAPAFINDWVSFGAGPRACMNLIIGAKARAILRGRYNVAIEDVQALALPVMRHRMGLNFAAQSQGVTTDHVVRKLLEAIPADERLYEGKI